ncbi:hypothetical protein MMC25_004448 [Agyrium rufum]|nr:hypothetical protein [Agyrium rufum]
MEEKANPAPQHQTTGIPRLSKLPLPRASYASQPSVSQLPTPGSSSIKPPAVSSTGSQLRSKRPTSIYGGLPSRTTGASNSNGPTTHGTMQPKSLRPPSRTTKPTTWDFSSRKVSGPQQAAAPLPSPQEDIQSTFQKPRRSLTTQTVESTAQGPASPSLLTNRRRSGFFQMESPMKAPPRPESAASRPSSRIMGTSGQTSTTNVAKPPRRAITSMIGSPKSNYRIPTTSPQKPHTPRSGIASRPKVPAPVTSPKPESASLTASPKPALASSAALRKTIADAKAARRAAAVKSNGSSMTPRMLDDDESSYNLAEVDPFALDLNEGPGVNVLHKRVNTARAEGRLNLSALSLTEIPPEAIHMYDPDAASNSKIAWYECVDLVKMMAADNEITSLDPAAFPDTPLDTFLEPGDAEPNRVFAALQSLDMHGNRLTSLPIGIRRLESLTILNLQRNQITNDTLDIISQIAPLKELRLGENALQGSLSASLGSLTNLEILDVHNNGITSLPFEMVRCAKLTTLDVSDNKLSSLPFEALATLPLVDILASKNRIAGSLFGSDLTFRTLKRLDISENAILTLAEHNINLPALQSIDVSVNRLSALSESMKYDNLTSLIAKRNQISSLPDGLYKLENLQLLDVQNNSLNRLDERLGGLSSLKTLRVEANPLRERRLLNLNSQDIVQELRNLSKPNQDLSVTSPRSPGFPGQQGVWELSGSTLDRSHTKLVTITQSDLEPFLNNNDESQVRTLILQHNLFQTIPPTLDLLSTTLTTLDLASNKLSTLASFLTEPLSLPNLQSLSLISNGLTSLTPLVDNLTAPSLSSLNVSFNRLTHLPILKSNGKFPALTKFLASNNKIEDLDVDAVLGLNVLDLAGNEIAHLPPRLGLCRGTLRTLVISGNRFRVPGWGVMQKGTEAVLEWCWNRMPVEEVVEREDRGGVDGGKGAVGGGLGIGVGIEGRSGDDDDID